MATRGHRWQDEASCASLDTKFFFEKYEEDPNIRPLVDEVCMNCPVMKNCFSNGFVVIDPPIGKDPIKTTGVFGGVYFNEGVMDEELNSHKDWPKLYEALTYGVH